MTFAEELLQDAEAFRKKSTNSVGDSLIKDAEFPLNEFQKQLIADADAVRSKKQVEVPVETIDDLTIGIEKEPTIKEIQLEKHDAEIADLNTQKASLANSLKDFSDDDNEGRKTVIDAIEALQVKIDSLTAARIVAENGGSPVAPTEEKKTVEKVAERRPLDFKEIANLRSQLSKAQKALEKNPDNLKIKVKIAEINEKLGK